MHPDEDPDAAAAISSVLDATRKDRGAEVRAEAKAIGGDENRGDQRIRVDKAWAIIGL